MSGTLVMMIGLPGSGKSTYAKKLLELNKNWKYVSRDEIRYNYVADQKHYWDHEYEVYQEFSKQIDMHLINGDVVIADATHLNKKSRDKLFRNLTSQNFEKIAIIMNTSFEVCFNRNSKRTGIVRVPDQVMYRMKNNYKPPTKVEGFDKILKVNG